MKIGTIAALGGASPNSVATAPAFAGLVVVHGGVDVVVDTLSFGQIAGFAGSTLSGEFGDDSIQGNELVGLQIATQSGIARRVCCARLGTRRIEANLVLQPVGDKSDHNIKTGFELLGRRLEQGKEIAIFRVAAFRMDDATLDAEIANLLIAVLLGQGKPEEKFSVCVFGGRNVNLISE
jgi:hypothetical protein